MKKLLIVDDDEHVALLYKSELDRKGFNTDVVYNAEDAIQICKNNKYDLIVLDIKLPGGKDGIAVLQELVNNRYPAKIIFNTAHDSFSKEYEIGMAHGFLLKTGDPEGLIEKIYEVLGMSTD